MSRYGHVSGFEELIFSRLRKEVGASQAYGIMEKIREIRGEIFERLLTINAPKRTMDLGFWSYNPHDWNHIERVAGNVLSMLPAVDLNIYELIILYLAVLGHDIALSAELDSLAERYLEMARKLDVSMEKTTVWRSLHGKLGAYMLREVLREKGVFSSRFNAIIAEIAGAHSGELKRKGNVTLNERFWKRATVRRDLLVGILRIADAMDCSRERLPPDEVISEVIALAGFIPGYMVQLEHYLRRYITIGVDIAAEPNKIDVTIQIDNGYPFYEIGVPGRGKVTGVKGYKGAIGEYEKAIREAKILEGYVDVRFHVEMIGADVPDPRIERWNVRGRELYMRFIDEPHPVMILMSPGVLSRKAIFHTIKTVALMIVSDVPREEVIRRIKEIECGFEELNVPVVVPASGPSFSEISPLERMIYALWNTFISRPSTYKEVKERLRKFAKKMKLNPHSLLSALDQYVEESGS